MKWFAPNLQRKGRILRGLAGLICLIAGLVLLATHWKAALALIGVGAFGLWEALRGWCLLRACGIKTRH